jgi:hypothetical protein
VQFRTPSDSPSIRLLTMASFSEHGPEEPVWNFTRKSDGTVTKVISTAYTTYPWTRSGQHTDTVKRAYPKNLYSSLTPWTYEERVTHCLGVGTTLEPGLTSWVVALPNRWWTGSLSSDTGYVTVDLSGRLRSKIKAQNVNLAVALAQYRQTADLFSRAANDIYRIFRSLRSGRGLRDIARWLKTPANSKQRDVASQWLRLQYGMRPLVSDLYGSAEALRTALTEGVWMHASVRDRNVRTGNRVWRPGTSGPYRGFSDWSVTQTVSLKAQYRVWDSTMKSLSSVGITNPAEVIWELIPYSFVVDWMFPVGRWLASLDALAGTTDFSYQQVVKIDGVESGSTYGGQFKRTYVLYSRGSRQTNLSLPRFGYKPSTHLGNVLNGLALLTLLKR